MLAVRRVLIIVLAVVVLWRITAVGVSDIYVAQLPQNDTGAVKAQAWYPGHPKAAYYRAAAMGMQDGAADELQRAYGLNPTDVRPLLALARLAAEQGNPERAGALAAEAARLQPANPRVQQQAAAFWVSQGNLERAMQHWSHALEADPSTRKDIFPVLLAIAEKPQLRGLFAPYMTTPPQWWEPFFAEVARRALDGETVRALQSIRRGTGNPALSTEERKAYIARLQRDGLVTEAYLVWVNGLSPEERGQLGLLHNGGFELPLTNTGFDWHVGRPDGVLIQTATTYGLEGAKALQLIFRRWERPFSHVHQPLFLDPGTYRVSGRVRTDSLQSVGGLKWVIRCSLPEAQMLAESERFLGSSEWRDFSFEVTVPETCVAQELRLASAGARDFEKKMAGGIWFDAMSARRIVAAPQPTPVAVVSPGTPADSAALPIPARDGASDLGTSGADAETVPPPGASADPGDAQGPSGSAN